MNSRLVLVLLGLCLALPAARSDTRAEPDRDFVFNDEDGHLVIRFAGTGTQALSAAQQYEILNQEFSRMVHDRLHADLQFANESRSGEWAASMETRISRHLAQSELTPAGTLVQCRTRTCRIILTESRHSSVAHHQAELDRAQAVIAEFIAANHAAFERVFLLTAYDQQSESPHIKAFLTRIGP